MRLKDTARLKYHKDDQLLQAFNLNSEALQELQVVVSDLQAFVIKLSEKVRILENKVEPENTVEAE